MNWLGCLCLDEQWADVWSHVCLFGLLYAIHTNSINRYSFISDVGIMIHNIEQSKFSTILECFLNLCNQKILLPLIIELSNRILWRNNPQCWKKRRSLQWCYLHVSSSQSFSKTSCVIIAFQYILSVQNYFYIFFPCGFCYIKMITGTCTQDKENADYVEWFKGQTELEEPEGVKDMVSRQVCYMIGNCFI